VVKNRAIGVVAAVVAICAGLAVGQNETGKGPAKKAPDSPTAPIPVPESKTPAETGVPAGTPTTKNAKAVTLKIGDAAPAFKADAWVKGDEVKSFEKGKVYVVSFWATWCRWCTESVPKLNAAQASSDDVIVIGMAGAERTPSAGPDTRKSMVDAAVKELGNGLKYRVAFESDREMVTSWMEAAGQDRLPTTFIVDGEGKIAWIGHPMGIEEPLAGVVAANEKMKKEAKKAAAGKKKKK
jgi:thiol-disulfide isomerase/thioredoxin